MNTPQSIGNEITNLAKQWQALAPTVSFGDSMIADYNTLVKPSLDSRTQLDLLDSQTKDWMKKRDEADAASHPEVLRIAGAIRSHKQFGPNSGLYKALGYVTDDEKKSGLHRGNGAATPTVAK